MVDAPEHDWGRAAKIVLPALRPVGTQGVRGSELDRDKLVTQAAKAHPQPLLDEGPLGLAVVYTIPADGFDVIVNTAVVVVCSGVAVGFTVVGVRMWADRRKDQAPRAR